LSSLVNAIHIAELKNWAWKEFPVFRKTEHCHFKGSTGQTPFG